MGMATCLCYAQALPRTQGDRRDIECSKHLDMVYTKSRTERMLYAIVGHIQDYIYKTYQNPRKTFKKLSKTIKKI